MLETRDIKLMREKIVQLSAERAYVQQEVNRMRDDLRTMTKRKNRLDARIEYLQESINSNSKVGA